MKVGEIFGYVVFDGRLVERAIVLIQTSVQFLEEKKSVTPLNCELYV